MLYTLTGFLVLVSLAMAQQACNGYSTLCSKSYNEVSYLTTHNSYAYMSNVGQNQHYDVQTQLNDGIRGLKLSAVKTNNYTGVELCHTACSILDAGTAHDTLSVIASWLKSNPNEVVTIMWNNLGNFSASDLQSEYQQAAGIMDYLYVQPNNNYTWPTLSEMISSGKRLVNFMDVNADQTTVPW
jgi:predicted O-linked N-acetylglucosamine transferase (SPINDLY family)